MSTKRRCGNVRFVLTHLFIHATFRPRLRYLVQGFFIPLDYGHIVGMVWVAHEVVLIALANGYVVLVSAPLLMRQRKNAAASAHGRSLEEGNQAPLTTKSMSTTRIFQNYLSSAIELEGSPAVLGDTSLKVLRVDMAKWGTDECLSMCAATLPCLRTIALRSLPA